LGDVFVILFFGLVAVGCTYYVQSSGITPVAGLLGLACGLVINNILIVNNCRDVEEDIRARKRTLVVFFRKKFAYYQYLLSTSAAIVVSLWLACREFGMVTLPALLPLSYSVFLAMRLSKLSCAPEYADALKGAGLVVATYGILLSLGIAL
ncbi:MAG: prenyltransferase, partial [Coraliomargarita sp.]